MSTPALRQRRLVVAGAVSNVVLAAVKLTAGIIGNSYALVADAIESFADLLGSVVIWGGLRIGAKPRSERHPYGYGKAEALAALIVGLMIFGAGIAIAVEAVREIVTPHHLPEPFTLGVLVVVVAVKETLFRVLRRAAAENESTAVKTDAWHHRADAITSILAFLGIGVALVTRWAPADDIAALLAAGIVLWNGGHLIATPARELLDVQADEVVARAARVAATVPGVAHVHKTFARKSGTGHWLDMHVWVSGAMSVRDAHTLIHRVKDAVRANQPRVIDVLIHVEPAREEDAPAASG